MIPRYEDIMKVIIDKLEEGKCYSILEIEKLVSEHFELDEEEKKLLVPGKKLGLFNHRVYWAILELKKLGYVNFLNGGKVKVCKKVWPLNKIRAIS